MNLQRRVNEYDNRRIHNSVLSSLIAISIFISIQDLEYLINDLTNQLYSQVKQTAPMTIPRNPCQSSTRASSVQSISYKKLRTLSSKTCWRNPLTMILGKVVIFATYHACRIDRRRRTRQRTRKTRLGCSWIPTMGNLEFSRAETAAASHLAISLSL